MNPFTRRGFLQTASSLGVAALLPLHAGRARGQSQGSPPAQKVRLAVVGTAQRGAANLKGFAKTGLAEVVALCDVDPAQKQAQEAVAAHPGAKSFTDFRRMFDAMAQGIDAVAVSTADHSHFAVAMHAMMLGKHVYVEKPLAHSFGECQRLMALAEATGVVTQMGNQGHSGLNHTQFKAWSEVGAFDEVSRVTAYMNLPRRWNAWGAGVAACPQEPVPAGLDWEAWTATAAEKPFSNRMHPGNWRGWFSHGSGCLGDWGPHLIDTTHRFLELGLPTSVAAVRREGTSALVYPQASTLRFYFPARGHRPACELTWHDGQNNAPTLDPELGAPDADTGEWTPLAVNPRKPGKVLYAGDHAFFGGSHGSALSVATRRGATPNPAADLPAVEPPPSNHWANFLLACAGQEQARSPFSVAAPLCQVLTLGMLAARFGGELTFDAATGRITNHAEADALLDPAPRAGWELYHTL